MFDPYFNRIMREPMDRAGTALIARGVSANQLTWASFALGLLAAAAIAFGLYTVGLLLFLGSRVADGLDGAVARSVSVTDFGTILEIVLTAVATVVVIGSFAVADAHHAVPAIVLVGSLVAVGTAGLSYAAIAAMRDLAGEPTHESSAPARGGLIESSETTVLLIVVLVWPHLFPTAAWIFSALCWVAVWQRFSEARATFERG